MRATALRAALVAIAVASGPGLDAPEPLAGRRGSGGVGRVGPAEASSGAPNGVPRCKDALSLAAPSAFGDRPLEGRDLLPWELTPYPRRSVGVSRSR